MVKGVTLPVLILTPQTVRILVLRVAIVLQVSVCDLFVLLVVGDL